MRAFWRGCLAFPLVFDLPSPSGSKMKTYHIPKSKRDKRALCFRYLEETLGRLSVSVVSTRWPDGSETKHVWQYSDGRICVTAQKTAMDAILLHIKSQNELSAFNRNLRMGFSVGVKHGK